MKAVRRSKGSALPLYEYQCRKCGRHFEKIRKFSDPPLRTCEKCGGQLERLVSAPAIQFKGSGWYVTDYAKKGAGESGSTPGEKSEKPAAGKSDGSSATESKKPSEPSKTKSKD
jgi:putative FmdB family regulatory protein